MVKIGKKILLFVLVLTCLAMPVNVNADTYSSKKDFLYSIRKNLIAHKSEFTIETSKSIMNEIGTDADLLNIVAAIDKAGTSKDGDYLKLSLNQFKTQWSWKEPGNTATLTFLASYKATLKQEQAVDAKIKSVLKALKLKDASDYKKVKAIHNYIIKRASYDQTLDKTTVYDLLIRKSAVCEGYTLAAYRMFTDAGIECRIITGESDTGESHAWNIVKVDGKWYNIDLTWDDPITSNGEQILRYDYFLKSNKDFKNHIRSEEYTTESFLKKYPIAETSYK